MLRAGQLACSKARVKLEQGKSVWQLTDTSTDQLRCQPAGHCRDTLGAGSLETMAQGSTGAVLCPAQPELLGGADPASPGLRSAPCLSQWLGSVSPGPARRPSQHWHLVRWVELTILDAPGDVR